MTERGRLGRPTTGIVASPGSINVHLGRDVFKQSSAHLCDFVPTEKLQKHHRGFRDVEVGFNAPSFSLAPLN